jgi:hypothetical protein
VELERVGTETNISGQGEEEREEVVGFDDRADAVAGVEGVLDVLKEKSVLGGDFQEGETAHHGEDYPKNLAKAKLVDQLPKSPKMIIFLKRIVITVLESL